jgi:DNA-binding CsgD family transcriptional regulator
VLGRDPELEQLGRALAAAEAGTGGFLLVAGEAGVGKTRLVDEALAGGGLLALRSVAAERGSTPYAPVVTALRGYLRARPDGLAGAAEGLGVLLPELGLHQGSPDRELLFETIRSAFATIAATQPTVLFLDDLHWADAATLELLPSLAAAAEEWPLLVLGAYRNEELPRGHQLRRLRTDLRRAGRFAELVLGPLDEPATCELSALILGGEPGPTLRAALYDRTQGVPFFVEELAAALGAGSSLVRTERGLELDAGATVPIPETVRDAVRLRTESLSGDAQRVLEAAAAAGTLFDLELLSALGEDAGLGEVLERGLLGEVEPGIAAFRHDLVREALYADTPWPRRRALHRALAEQLESCTVEPRLVADHWLAAHEGSRARPFLLAAAQRFCSLHAYRDAAAAGRKALELWSDGEDEPGRLAALGELGRCAELCGELGEAARAWEELAAALDPADGVRVGDVKRGLATVYQLQGRAQRAVAARTEAAEAFAAAGEHAEAAADYLAVGFIAGDDPQAFLAVARAALRTARRAQRADLEARALAKEAFASFRLGRQQEGTELARAGLAIALAGKYVEAAVDAYWVLGTIANHWADYETAEGAFVAAVDFCRANDRHPDELVCLSCLTLVLYNRGDWEQAEALARDVLALPDVEETARAHALCALGLISAARGATRRARSLLEKAAAVRRAVGLMTAPQCAVGFAFADEIEGASGEHWHELVRARPRDITLFYVQGLRWASTYAVRRKDAALVQACADALSTWSATFGGPDVQAGLAHVLGEFALLEGEPARASEQFTQALELMRDVDAPFHRAHVQMRLGLALAAAGQREAGVERLVEAYRTFRKLGARPFCLQAAGDLEALGEPVNRRLGRRAAGELERRGLTRRELEILRLVAVGRTNREIGQELFLSPRTVEMHVRHMLAKLNCRSRTEATGKAHALGLLAHAVIG